MLVTRTPRDSTAIAEIPKPERGPERISNDARPGRERAGATDRSAVRLHIGQRARELALAFEAQVGASELLFEPAELTSAEFQAGEAQSSSSNEATDATSS